MASSVASQADSMVSASTGRDQEDQTKKRLRELIEEGSAALAEKMFDADHAWVRRVWVNSAQSQVSGLGESKVLQ